MKWFIRRTLAFAMLATTAFPLVACPSSVRSNRADSPAARARQRQQEKQQESQPSTGTTQEESSDDEDWLDDV